MMLGCLVKAKRVVFVVVRIVRHSGGEREVGAGVERRVDVDQVHLAGELRRAATAGRTSCRPRSAGCARAPRLRRELEQALLAVLRRLVDRLDGLERQRHPQRRDALARWRRTCRPRSVRFGWAWGNASSPAATLTASGSSSSPSCGCHHPSHPTSQGRVR